MGPDKKSDCLLGHIPVTLPASNQTAREDDQQLEDSTRRSLDDIQAGMESLS